MRYVSRLCRLMPIQRVTELVPINETVARRWDKKVLMQTLPESNLDELEVLLVDEKSIGKRHQYATLVMNGQTGELLNLAEGKKKGKRSVTLSITHKFLGQRESEVDVGQA